MTENHEFNEIYEKYKNSVLHAAYLYAKDSDMAEDIRQETFLKLLRLMECEEPAVNIESWLYITARNMALNYRKRMKAEMPLIQEDEAETPSSGLFRESTEDEYLEMQANRMRADLHDRIMSALWEKNERWYEAILLAAHMGLSYKEAAKVMGVSLNAYQVMLHRARVWIRDRFGVEYEELKKK